MQVTYICTTQLGKGGAEKWKEQGRVVIEEKSSRKNKEHIL